ncbi:hypothetical protein ARTHRO8AJ_190046 [Arthrobacter sp. 8AJ]|nr:hypothetical protein ARTHRO8AJ_190046 [Arthrobacter sp. 8AJ]
MTTGPQGPVWISTHLPEMVFHFLQARPGRP